MRNYITVDGGTTTTRISLVQDMQLKDTIKLGVGARANMEQPGLLEKELKGAIESLLTKHALSEADITRILASGMITSEFGLCKLDHIQTPAGLTELHDSMFETVISEISSVPFVFVRGVKTDATDFRDTDMMRGEEVELMGIINPDYGKCIYILPGSHSKVIQTDAQGRIVDFSTMLTGEMIASLSQNTILKDAVDLTISETDAEYLLKGYDCCENAGVNKALFKTRILKNIYGCTAKQTYSFFIGVVLHDELVEINKADTETIVLGGKAQIKEAMALILNRRCDKKLVVLSENDVSSCTAKGIIKIYEGEK
ncbi:MAG: 2-dehydro-3-deoxygalactonokinase [Clostridia bacterium]|nr:2-dehydro-3-deoxygalactonokinase [Clostridia bacterium]